MGAKSVQASSDKWQRRASQATQDYQEGVNNPRAPWAASTAAAADRYKDGVQKSITRNSFQKGVAKAGDATWIKGATQKGPNRFAEGVSVSADKYQQGFAPYQQVLASAQLPPKFAKGDPRNYERSKAVGALLRAKKESGA